MFKEEFQFKEVLAKLAPNNFLLGNRLIALKLKKKIKNGNFILGRKLNFNMKKIIEEQEVAEKEKF